MNRLHSDPRFSVTYRINGDKQLAQTQAATIRLEQTIELGEELVPQGFIEDQIIGQIESFRTITSQLHEVTISYSQACTAGELTQLLNVIFGNTSIKEGIRVVNLDLNPELLQSYSGPRFGITGLRQAVGVPDKPLLCTALKPMGYSPKEIAGLAYQFALGGVDVIKDDHGLSNQPFCPFEDRVEACVEAVAKGNRESGNRSIYAPNITAPCDQIFKRARSAKRAGAGALLVAPGLTGFDTLRALSQDSEINLPLLSHPALLGSHVISPNNGFDHRVLFGTLQRLAGADVSIFPNYGGRFGFSRDQCGAIAQGCQEPLGDFPAIFPSPGGGMTIDRIEDMLQLYGSEVLFLVGGGLYSGSPDLARNTKSFLKMIGRDV